MIKIRLKVSSADKSDLAKKIRRYSRQANPLSGPTKAPETVGALSQIQMLQRT
jgi:hypothetical protein